MAAEATRYSVQDAGAVTLTWGEGDLAGSVFAHADLPGGAEFARLAGLYVEDWR